MTGKESIDNKTDEFRAIAERHGARKFRLFGSIARGESMADGDVDFPVEFEPGRSLEPAPCPAV